MVMRIKFLSISYIVCPQNRKLHTKLKQKTQLKAHHLEDDAQFEYDVKDVCLLWNKKALLKHAQNISGSGNGRGNS